MPTRPPLYQPPGRPRRERGGDGRSAHERGYTAKWRKASKAYLERHPACVGCAGEGRATPATVVDHVVAHKGDHGRFWDEANWQALCTCCHNRKTAREGGFGRGGG